METPTEKRVHTYEEIRYLPEGNYEIINGERRDMTPTSFEHGDFEARLGEFLRSHLKGKGYVAVGEVGILITKSPLRVRAADIVYISREQAPQRPKGILETPPDLIIEVISESNAAWEITDKVKDYLSIGVERIVLIDPLTQTVSLFRKGSKEAAFCDFSEECNLIEGLSVIMKELLY